jgi:hypothetical protein
MALVQIRIKCEHRFRDCPRRCFGCKEAKVIEVKALSGMKNDGNEKERPKKCRRCGLPYGTCIHTTLRPSVSRFDPRKDGLRFNSRAEGERREVDG